MRKPIVVLVALVIIGLSSAVVYRYMTLPTDTDKVTTETPRSSDDEQKQAQVKSDGRANLSEPASTSITEDKIMNDKSDESATQSEESKSPPKEVDESTIYVGSYLGKVGLFIGNPKGEGKIYRKLDIDINGLPPTDQVLIKQGIRVENEAEALTLLEGWRGMLD